MEIEKLNYFIAVSQTESIRKASELLHLAPSTISKAIAKLEMELDTKLITEAGKGIQLTLDGREFAERASRLMQEFNLLKEQTINKKKLLENHPLRISTFETFSTYFLAKLGSIQWKQRELNLHEALPGKLEQQVENGDVDFGITYIPVPHPKVEHIKITSIEMGVFKRRQFFKNIQQQDLPFVVPVQPIHAQANRVRGLDGWPDDAYPRKILHRVTLMESALELCRQGRTAGYFPAFIIREHNRKHKEEFQLERHPSPFPGRICRSDVFLVKRMDRREDKDMRLIAKMLRLCEEI